MADNDNEKCVFCMIASKRIPSNPVYEDEAFIAVLDINPASKGHCLLIPKAHYNSLYEAPQNVYLQIMSLARAIGYALLISQGATNVDLIYTQELIKGNVTPHSIIHIIPRYKDDTINYTWQPNKLTKEELEAIANEIKSAIEKVKEGEKPVEQPPQQKQAPPPPEEKPIQLDVKPVVF
ncbi:MAG: HIT family protein [Candidatus Parvarchaeota archaeon]|nr:HIT family protein [Candidatus Parvarchaeota archaeon]